MKSSMTFKSHSVAPSRPAVVPCGIAIVLIFVFGTIVLLAQAEQNTPSLFGVPLDAKASALLTEVEQLYGKPIRVESLSVDDPMAGRSRVGDDGTPIISINPNSGRRPDVIVHELYHLLLQPRGYPIILSGGCIERQVRLTRLPFSLSRLAFNCTTQFCITRSIPKHERDLGSIQAKD
jgi:hypothetical protein